MRKVILFSFALFAAGMIASVPASATTIPVANSSFETLPIGGLNDPCGPTCSFSTGLGIPGWTTTGDGTGQWIIGGFAGNPSATDGNVIAYSNGGTIFQTVGNAVAGASYTLQVDMLHRTDLPAAGTVELEINGVSVATASGVDGGSGTWSTWTANYTATATDAGQSLSILLGSSGAQADFDNVRLSVSGVPEASTWAMLMLGFAGLGLASYRSSRRSAAAAV